MAYFYANGGDLMLTTKQEIFVQKLIEGCSQRDSYKFAYDCKRMSDKSIDEEASKLLKKPKVATRYEELKEELKEKSFYTVEKANQDLEWIKAKAKEDIEYRGLKQANANAYLGATKQQIELNGITIKEAKKDIDNTFKIQLVGAFDEPSNS